MSIGFWGRREVLWPSVVGLIVGRPGAGEDAGPVVGREDGATVRRPALAVLVRLRCLEDGVPDGRVGVAGVLDV